MDPRKGNKSNWWIFKWGTFGNDYHATHTRRQLIEIRKDGEISYGTYSPKKTLKYIIPFIGNAEMRSGTSHQILAHTKRMPIPKEPHHRLMLSIETSKEFWSYSRYKGNDFLYYSIFSQDDAYIWKFISMSEKFMCSIFACFTIVMGKR